MPEVGAIIAGMDTGIAYLLGGKLVALAVATFFAILSWSRTRDVAWMLIVAGTIASYAEIVLDIMAAAGILPEVFLRVAGMPIGEMAASFLPWMLYAAAFAVMAAKNRI